MRAAMTQIAVLASAILLPGASTAAAKQPNILFLLADDLGYNELGYMNESRGLITPNIDALAKSGIMFSDYHVQPICSPTRSALMTGRYPVHIGTQGSVIYWDTPWGVPLEQKFMSRMLSEAGYETGMFGKWHLGMFKEEYCPWKRGFDEYEGYLQGCGSHWTHESACCNANGIDTDAFDYICPAGKYGAKDFRGYDWFNNSGPVQSANQTNSVDIIKRRAKQFFASRASSDKPWFLYLPFQNIHSPYQCGSKYKNMFANRTDLSDEQQTMFAYITELDDAIGSVISDLRASGRYDETLIIFSSDNGAPPVTGVEGRNYPLQGFKSSIWEGGQRVPGFVAGNLVPEKLRGTWSDIMFHVTDWLPTIARIANATDRLPTGIDGVDQWDALTQEGAKPARNEMLLNLNPLCRQPDGVPGGFAKAPKAGYRIGNYKILTYCYAIPGQDNQTKLGPYVPESEKDKDWPKVFDLSKDIGETTNIRDQEPEITKQLLAKLEQYAKSSVITMQWAAPFQGEGYFCADCPLRSELKSPTDVWTPWL